MINSNFILKGHFFCTMSVLVFKELFFNGKQYLLDTFLVLFKKLNIGFVIAKKYIFKS